MKRKKKPYFKINSSTIILLTAFLIGLGIVLYPSVSDYINARHQTRAIAGYREAVEDLTEEDYARLRQEADDFNRELEEAGSILTLTDAQEEEYYSLLDPAGTGMMGYLEIESIDVYLPVYHGTEDTVLQVGAGHVEGSSLPVGGEGTHCVLSGHRGLPSSICSVSWIRWRRGMYFSSMCWMRLLLMRWIRSGSCCLMKWRPCHFTGRRPVHTGHLHAIRSEYPPAARPGAPGGIYRKDHGIRTGGRGADRSVDRRVGTGSSGICYPAGGSAYRTAVEKETEKERKVVHEL